VLLRHDEILEVCKRKFLTWAFLKLFFAISLPFISVMFGWAWALNADMSRQKIVIEYNGAQIKELKDNINNKLDILIAGQKEIERIKNINSRRFINDSGK